MEENRKHHKIRLAKIIVKIIDEAMEGYAQGKKKCHTMYLNLKDTITETEIIMNKVENKIFDVITNYGRETMDEKTRTSVHKNISYYIYDIREHEILSAKLEEYNTEVEKLTHFSYAQMRCFKGNPDNYCERLSDYVNKVETTKNKLTSIEERLGGYINKIIDKTIKIYIAAYKFSYSHKDVDRFTIREYRRMPEIRDETISLRDEIRNENQLIHKRDYLTREFNKRIDEIDTLDKDPYGGETKILLIKDLERIQNELNKLELKDYKLFQKDSNKTDDISIEQTK